MCILLPHALLAILLAFSQPVGDIQPDPSSSNAAERLLAINLQLDPILQHHAALVEFDPREFRLYKQSSNEASSSQVEQTLISHEPWIKQVLAALSLERFECPVSPPSPDRVHAPIHPTADRLRRQLFAVRSILHAEASRRIVKGDVDGGVECLIALLQLADKARAIQDPNGRGEELGAACAMLACDAIRQTLTDTIASIRFSARARKNLASAITDLDPLDPCGVFGAWKSQHNRIITLAECQLEHGSIGNELMEALRDTHDLIAVFTYHMQRSNSIGFPVDDGLSLEISRIHREDRDPRRPLSIAYMLSLPAFSHESLVHALDQSRALGVHIQQIWFEPDAGERLAVFHSMSDQVGLRTLALNFPWVRWMTWRRAQDTFTQIRVILDLEPHPRAR